MRLLAALVLCLLANLASAVATNTNVALTKGGTPPFNLVTTATINSTENTVTFTVTAGAPRTVMLVSTDTAWYYRSAASGTNLPVAAGQTLTLRFASGTVIYFVRQSADGNLLILPLLQVGDSL